MEEGLQLIDDNNYTVPKYHFNRKAAYAFAARFYLYHQKYDQAIECANIALGDNAALVTRDWGALGKHSLNDNLQPDAYVDAANKANLLLTFLLGVIQRAANYDQPLYSQSYDC